MISVLVIAGKTVMENMMNVDKAKSSTFLLPVILLTRFMKTAVIMMYYRNKYLAFTVIFLH